MTEEDFICQTSLIIDLPLSLCSGLVIPNESILPATSGSVTFKAMPRFWLLFLGLSPRRSDSYPWLGHVKFLFDNFANWRMIQNTSCSPISVIPKIPEINIAFTFPQNHKLISLSLNNTTFSFPVQTFSNFS